VFVVFVGKVGSGEDCTRAGLRIDKGRQSSAAKTGLLRKALLMHWFACCAFHFGLTELLQHFLNKQAWYQKFVVIADGCLHFHLLTITYASFISNQSITYLF
jgi:hypothetical protein